MGQTTGPLDRHQGHLALTGILIGNDKLIQVMRQADKSVVAAAVKLSLRRGVKIAQDSIQDHAARIPSHRSFGVYSRSLGNQVNMGGRFHGVGIVGNRRDYREGPFRDPGRRGNKAKRGVRKSRGKTVRVNKGLRVVGMRRPAKYWHFVEYGVYGGRGHHLVLRAVKKVEPQQRAAIEATNIEVLSRHFNVPPLVMAAHVAAGTVP